MSCTRAVGGTRRGAAAAPSALEVRARAAARAVREGGSGRSSCRSSSGSGASAWPPATACVTRSCCAAATKAVTPERAAHEDHPGHFPAAYVS
eukprot:scaffold1929_cov376-Prasinococcus_capsulatus_cf.AAC.15